MITSPLDLRDPNLSARAAANYERLAAQLGRLDDDALAVMGSAMLAAAINASVAVGGAAETALWLTSLADELLEDDDSALDDQEL